jgi:hypothetical protein
MPAAARMPIDWTEYEVPRTHTLWDRLAFRLEHRLLAAGPSAMGQLRGYLRMKEWRDCSSTRERLHALKVAAKLPARALRDARRAVATYGGPVAQHDGVSPGQQLLHLWWLRVRHGVHPTNYYAFRLHKPGQWRRAPAFFQDYEPSRLFRLLHLHTAPDEAELLLDKVRFERWLVERGFPAARTIMEISRGAVVRSSLRDGELPRRDLFVKPNDSLQGLNTHRWHYDGEAWVGMDGRRRDERELMEELITLSRTRELLVQERLRNHAAISALAPGALGTVRVLTLRGEDGVVRVVLAVCKIPVGSAPTDHMRLGGVAAPIDLGTGRLGPAIGKSESAFVEPCERHPDTGVVIEGFQLPHWDGVMRLAVSAHEALERIVCIGWDIAILEDGPVIVEGNDNPGHTSSQLPTGIALGETPVVPTMLAHLRAAFAGAPLGAARNASRDTPSAAVVRDRAQRTVSPPVSPPA